MRTGFWVALCLAGAVMLPPAGAQFPVVVNGQQQAWTATGLILEEGEVVEIEASGCIWYGGMCGSSTPLWARTNPDGECCTGGAPGGGWGPNFVCLNAEPMMLVGQIAGGDCFALGSSVTFASPLSGELLLCYNDTYGGFSDNCHSFNVIVTLPERPVLKVTVVDALNGVGIPLAAVAIENAAVPGVFVIQDSTDADGNLRCQLPLGNIYNIRASKAGRPGEHDAYHAAVYEDFDPSVQQSVAIGLETNTVVLVHGVLSSAETWTAPACHFQHELAQMGGFHVPDPVTLVDDPSAWLFGDAGSVASQAGVLLDHLNGLSALGIKSVHIVAHSMGGLVSRHLVQSHPGRVAKLVMLGTPNHGSELASDVEGFKALVALRLCNEHPLACAGIFQAMEHLAAAARDLAPKSQCLKDLNYSNPSDAKSNWFCQSHPPESFLGSETIYYTYKGTGFLGPLPTELLPFWCHPDMWRRPLIAGLGNLLAYSSLCPMSDAIVPHNSVPLDEGNVNVHNWSDIQCECLSSHTERRDECPPMTADPCVVRAVKRMLCGEILDPSPDSPLVRFGREDPVPGSLLLSSTAILSPGEVWEGSASVGSADSLAIAATIWSGDCDLELLDPAGVLIDPDSALANPLIDYFENDFSRRYIIREAALGEWTAIVREAGGLDSAFAVVHATEYGQLHLRVDLTSRELMPGDGQRAEVTIEHAGTPVLGVSVAGMITDPGGQALPCLFVDDGTGGDVEPDDGIYTVLFSHNSRPGGYTLELFAEGSYGSGAELRRGARTDYQVVARPDAEVTPEEIALTPMVDSTGLVIRVQAVVRNVGVETAHDVACRFVDDTALLVFDEVVLPELAAGEGLVIEAAWPVESADPSERWLGVEVTVMGPVADANVTNNRALGTIAVAGVEGPGVLPGGPEWRGGASTGRPGLSASPNPFGQGTSLAYRLESTSQLTLQIFDASGRQVRQLYRGMQTAGEHMVHWDGRNDDGIEVGSGIYFAKLHRSKGSQILRMMLVR